MTFNPVLKERPTMVEAVPLKVYRVKVKVGLLRIRIKIPARTFAEATQHAAGLLTSELRAEPVIKSIKEMDRSPSILG
jgi:hypothetical protein